MKLITSWRKLPPALRNHLIERVKARHISVADLQKFDFWLRRDPDVPAGKWFRDFGSFVLCGEGSLITTFLEPHMIPHGEQVF